MTAAEHIVMAERILWGADHAPAGSMVQTSNLDRANAHMRLAELMLANEAAS
jgi:hypothetical protein